MKPEDLTTWVLEEANPEERAAIESQIQSDPNLKGQADATRDFCNLLTDQLGNSEDTLSDAQRETLVAAPKKTDSSPPRRSSIPWWRRPGPATLAAAAVVTLMGGLALMREGELSDAAQGVVSKSEADFSDRIELQRLVEGEALVRRAETKRIIGESLGMNQATDAGSGSGSAPDTSGAKPAPINEQFGLEPMSESEPVVVEFDGFIGSDVAMGRSMGAGGGGANGMEMNQPRAQQPMNPGVDKYNNTLGDLQTSKAKMQNPNATPAQQEGAAFARAGQTERLGMSEAEMVRSKTVGVSGSVSHTVPVDALAADDPAPASHFGAAMAPAADTATSRSTGLATSPSPTSQPQPATALTRSAGEEAKTRDQVQRRSSPMFSAGTVEEGRSDAPHPTATPSSDAAARGLQRMNEGAVTATAGKTPAATPLPILVGRELKESKKSDELQVQLSVADERTVKDLSLVQAERLRILSDEEPRPQITPSNPRNEAYTPIYENLFQRVEQEPLSTFSIDVDTASYANVRRFLNDGQRPPPDAVRIEELVNYFDYDYEQPLGDVPFSVQVDIANAPWNPTHRLARIGLKGREIVDDRQPGNFVFLVDVSGSMNSPDKLPLVQKSLRLLAKQLGDNDRVAIVTYAGNSGLALESTAGADAPKILEAIDRMKSGGSTHGSAGIRLAYEQAVENFIEGGINRVILCTDGDFNVGISDPAELEQVIAQKAKSGVFLSVLGFGTGNLKDRTMETLADKGNGNYAYIDSLGEARKVLVQQMNATLVTIAKDVKIQVEFNPAQVQSYRLIGYENRMLAKEDFNDDTKDAGEIGAGHVVTALYELVPVGVTLPDGRPVVDDLKYQAPVPAAKPAAGPASSETMTVKLRYKQPDGDTSKLLEMPVTDEEKTMAASPRDFQFASAVAGFGMLLRNSAHKGELTWDMVRKLALEGKGRDKLGYRGEFIQLIDKAQGVCER